MSETAGSEPVESSVEMPDAATDEQLIGMLVDRARSEGLQLTGEGGLLQQLTKRVLESAFEGEIADHLGYGKHEAAGRGSGTSRNGTRAKTVLTDVGPVEIKVPRDVAGTFEPQLVKKRQRRLKPKYANSKKPPAKHSRDYGVAATRLRRVPTPSISAIIVAPSSR